MTAGVTRLKECAGNAIIKEKSGKRNDGSPPKVGFQKRFAYSA